VWELAVEGRSDGQSPLHIQRSPCPTHFPLTPVQPRATPCPPVGVVSAELAGVGAGVDQFGGSSSSAVGCLTPCIQRFPLRARDPDGYSFRMTSDLSLWGGVLELAVESLSHGQSPLRIQRPPPPIHTPHNTPQAPWPSHLLFSPAPRRETTRRVHRPRASSTPTAHHHHHWQLLPSHEHEHDHVCTSTTVYGKSRVVHVAAAEGCVQ
jgi:hypothetical protein